MLRVKNLQGKFLWDFLNYGLSPNFELYRWFIGFNNHRGVVFVIGFSRITRYAEVFNDLEKFNC